MIETKLNQIQIYTKKGCPPKNCLEANLLSGYGIIGDRHEMDEKNPISISDMKTIQWKNDKKVLGLCFKKFSANLILDSLPQELFNIGYTFYIGDAIFEVVSIGKKCYKNECELFKTGDQCLLTNGIIYVKSLTDSKICTGDYLKGI
ncbi:molybdenum cofactor biosynthesis protein C [Lachnospiraceae bacterium TWA4]|nr:molybdenum cofactor biosynthesis protein C [Lachnospiraceae bacterium TWA4]